MCSTGNTIVNSAGSAIGSTLIINEISTVAMAYAVAGYAVDSTHIYSSGSAAAVQGINNAFTMAGNLVDMSGTGGPVANVHNASVPVSTINTLANIIASCVNTTGPTSYGCSTLFAAATSTGTSTGNIPTDTATAAINMAHYPAANVTTLFNLPPATPPFQPILALPPNDLTVQLTYTGNGIGDPWAIAIDGAGNAWVASAAAGSTAAGASSPAGSIAEISPTATVISPPNGYESTYFNTPGNAANAIAIDGSNNVWVATSSSVTQLDGSGAFTPSAPFLVAGAPFTGCSSANFSYAYGIAFDMGGNAWITGDSAIYKLSPFGVNQSGCGYRYYNPYGSSNLAFNTPFGIAVDGGNHIWIADFYADLVVELNSDGSQAPQIYADPSLQSPNALAIDNQNNIWVANFGGTHVTKISSSLGAVASTPSGYGLIDDAGVAVDGSGNAWFTPNTNNNIGAVELSSSGTALSGANGYATSAPTTSPNDHYWSAIDGSGNVWVANTYADSVSEILGAATPVVTPLATAVANGQLGVKP